LVKDAVEGGAPGLEEVPPGPVGRQDVHASTRHRGHPQVPIRGDLETIGDVPFRELGDLLRRVARALAVDAAIV